MLCCQVFHKDLSWHSSTKVLVTQRQIYLSPRAVHNWSNCTDFTDTRTQMQISFFRYMYKKLCKGGSIYIEECVAYIFFLYMAAVPVSFFSLLLLSGSIHMCANQRSKRKKKNVVSQNIFLNLLFFLLKRDTLTDGLLRRSCGPLFRANSSCRFNDITQEIFCKYNILWWLCDTIWRKNRLFKINAVFRIS